MKNPRAFPNAFGERGMTLRDYFAAKAMAAVLNEPYAVHEIDKMWPDALQERIAIGAYRMADAMLAEREKTDAS